MNKPALRNWHGAKFGLLALGITLVLGLCAWFFVLPSFVQKAIDNEIGRAEKSLQRKIHVNGFKLKSPWSFSVQDLELYDVNSDLVGLRCTEMRASFNQIPWRKSGLRFESISIDECKIWVRSSQGRSNFDDILQKLKPRQSQEPREAKKTSALARMFSPLPRIDVRSIQFDMLPVSVKDKFGLSLQEINQLEVYQNDEKRYIGQATIQTQLTNSASQLAQKLSLAFELKSSKEGNIKVSPLEAQNTGSLLALDIGQSSFALSSISFQLPTTLVLNNMRLEENGQELFSAEALSLRFMTLPPKKVSGVYFKEVEALQPKLSLLIDQSGKSNAQAFVEELRANYFNAPKETNDAPRKEKTIEDYFFSQRLFLHDASFSLHDSRPNAYPDIQIAPVSLELGYRSIKKNLTLLLELSATKPLQLDTVLRADYGLPSQEALIELNLHESGSIDKLAGLFAAAKNDALFAPYPAAIKYFGLLEHAVQRLDFRQTVLNAAILIEHNEKSAKSSAKGTLQAKDFSLQADSVAELPMSFDVSTDFTAQLQPSALTLRTQEALFNGIPFQFSVGTQSSAQSDPVPGTAFELSFTLPAQNAQTVFEAIPIALRSSIDGLQFSGNFGYRLLAKGLLAQIQNMQLDINIDTDAAFSITRFPANRNILALNEGFVHQIVDPNALSPHSVTIPPSIYPVSNNYVVYQPVMTAGDIRQNYPDWVLFEDLNPYLVQLITTTEDGSFFSHHGFSTLQIKAALAKNIDRGEFTRGASTITMQLIKNLFFDRSKSVARKFQEALYTWLTESIYHIPKQRLLEIYFNVIEFGPEIYGIQQAARYYFGKRSSELSLKECAFIMSIIPKPRSGQGVREQGSLSPSAEKTVRWFIDEMLRRKCKPETIQASRERYAKRGLALPFEPCCPAMGYIESIKAQTLQFYAPDPLTSPPLRPDLYDESGHLRVTSKKLCGFTDESSVLFEEWLPETEELPSLDQL